jgi:hypothetical protein
MQFLYGDSAASAPRPPPWGGGICDQIMIVCPSAIQAIHKLYAVAVI